MAKDRIIEPINADFERVAEALLKSNKPIQGELELPLIKHEEAGEIIYQRLQDGYVNATAMCKATGKEWSNYNKAISTQEFFEALESDLQIGRSELILSIKGGVPSMQGTWVHPQVAIHLAQWLSPKFAVLVTKWVFDWMSGNTPKSEIPYHLRRYIANIAAIPAGYFSVLQEMTIVLIAPLEQQGYSIPSNVVPDISEGKMFCNWLKKQGIDTNQMPTYIHRYEDGRQVPAKMYPSKYLTDFRQHVSEVWLPKRAMSYFKERDEKAVPYLQNILQISANVKYQQLSSSN